MRVVQVEQRTPEWHAWRARGVTASQAAIVCGRSPYCTPWRLWAQRSGLLEPPRETFLMRRGRELEDRVREAYERAHATVLLPVCGEWEEWPVARASFDGIDDAGEPVELKCSSARVHAELRERGRESGTYRLYVAQLQHQLLVCGARRGRLAVGRQDAPGDLVELAVERDPAFIEEMLAAERAFWGALERGEPPEPDPHRDLYVPAPGSDARRRWVEEAARYRAAAAGIEELERALAAQRAVQAEVRERLGVLLGEFAAGEAAGLRLVRSVRRGTVDWRALAEALAGARIEERLIEAHRRAPSVALRATLRAPGTAEVAIEPGEEPGAARGSFYF